MFKDEQRYPRKQLQCSSTSKISLTDVRLSTRRFLAAIGDVNNPATFSGRPYYFLQAAKKRGILDEGLSLVLTSGAVRLTRAIWSATRLIFGERPRGSWFSVPFLETIWAPYRRRLQTGVVINCFQLYPPSIYADPSIEKWFHLDQTLLQLLDHYGLRSKIGRQIAREAVERERQGYHTAAGIIVESHWAARSIIEDYGISPDRVHIVLPGANLDPDAYFQWEKENQHRERNPADLHDPVRFVFIGRDWKRKGLDRLLGAFAIARRRGSRAILRIIGCQQESLPASLKDIPGVEWCGIIDKRRESQRFLHLVSECDVGCLLSRAEAGGLAQREYLALGLALLSTDAGGASEFAIPGTSVVVGSQASDDEIASILLELEKNSTWLAALRATAWQQRQTALWDESVTRMLEFWPHRAEPDKSGVLPI